MIKALQEGLGGIRDVLLDGTQRFYCDIYRKADASLRQAQASNSFISQGPRYAIEALGVALIAVLAYNLSFGAGGNEIAGVDRLNGNCNVDLNRACLHVSSADSVRP